MTDERDDHEILDTRLRRALDADAATVTRVTRSALAAGAAAEARRGRRWLPAAALAAAGLVLAVWLGRSPGRPPAEAPTSGRAVHIYNHGEVLTVRDAAGNVWLRHRDGEPLGQGPRLVILRGEPDD